MSLELFFQEKSFDFDKEKSKIINNLDFLKNLSVQEHTFYKKYQELQTYKDLLNDSDIVKAQIWNPKDVSKIEGEIEKLEPEIVHVNNNEILTRDWLILRVFGHTMTFDQSPGRFIKFLVRDKNTKQYLGVFSIGSDVLCIKDRDSYIGWNEHNRIKDKLINNTAIANCIMPTQPFGYNFLGGKLIAVLSTSSVVQDVWKKLYNDILVGMTTTSLYGIQSMYCGMPKYWHVCGESEGKIFIKPDDYFYDIWKDWIKDNCKEEFDNKLKRKDGDTSPVTNPKQRIISLILDSLKIKKSEYVHGYKRGVFFSSIYENTREFLNNKIKETDLKIKSHYVNQQTMVDWWKEKAIKRYISLRDKNLYNPEVLFYNKGCGISYVDFKKKYFKEVGR